MTGTFFDGFRAAPARVAFQLPDGALTYGELDAASAQYLASLRRLGVEPGDRVAVFGGSGRALIIALVGHLRGGLIHVPINTRYRDQEITHILQDSGAKLFVTEAHTAGAAVAVGARASGLISHHIGWGDPVEGALDFESMMVEEAEGEEAPPPPGEAAAMLIYTSGTTGQSKGVALSHGALLANISATTTLWRWSAADHLILALPLFHVHGLGLGVLGSLRHQMTATVLADFDAGRTVATFAAQRASIFMGVPTMYTRLVAWLQAHPEAREDLRAGRLFTSGSAALPATVLEAFEALTGHRILERYGMSETGFTLSNPYDGERRAGTVGHPIPGYEVRLVGDDGRPVAIGEMGEIHVRGDGLLTSYWGQRAATDAAFTGGWFRTGDVAVRDEDGYHRIVGRRSADIIKSGGFKISAREIEDILRRHPGVADVAVLGVPDTTWGEVIAAAVVPADPEALPSDPEALVTELAAHTRAHLADYKRPRLAVRLDTLPCNALGKVQKHHIRALFAP